MSLNYSHNWQILNNTKVAAIEFAPIDRLYLLQKISSCYHNLLQEIYFWNPGYEFLQKVDVDNFYLKSTKYRINIEHPVSIYQSIEHSCVLIFEGLGNIDRCLQSILSNFYFDCESTIDRRILLVDSQIDIPVEMFAIVPNFKLKIPQHDQIKTFLTSCLNREIDSSIVQSCYGLSIGEIEILTKNSSRQELNEKVVDYKTRKLSKQGLRIVPRPDVAAVGGLDALEHDLSKIKVLFSSEARQRGLKPPQACCLWGLPGTGKSLVSKMMSWKLNATLVACEWNDLLDTELSRSLSKLQYMLDVVDGIGNCVLFFDEFEKAFAGWNSSSNGGVLAKMAGKLLTWMQDHESPVIMLATINHLDMLPPELIRRFNYIWFFDSNLHNGAMYEVFQLHLEKHFPGIQEEFTDTQWRNIFANYRGCSPAEIAGAVARTHHELLFKREHLNLTIENLIFALNEERRKFKPAILNKTTSNALAKILMESDFARPVRGKDTSRFATSTRGLFEKEIIEEKTSIDEYVELFYEITQGELKESNYSCLF